MNLTPALLSFTLHLVRLSAALALMPPFAERAGARLAVVVVALWAAVALSAVGTPVAAPPSGLGALLAAAAGEAALGALLGMGLRLALLPLEASGELLAQEAGLTVAHTLDPVSGVPSSSLQALVRALAVLALLSLGGLETGLLLLGRSFQLLPAGLAGAAALRPQALEAWVLLFARATRATLELALPLLTVSALATAGSLLLAKALPRLNLFTDVLPLRALVLLGGLHLFLPSLLRGVGWGLDQATGSAGAAVLAGAGG